MSYQLPASPGLVPLQRSTENPGVIFHSTTALSFGSPATAWRHVLPGVLCPCWPVEMLASRLARRLPNHVYRMCCQPTAGQLSSFFGTATNRLPSTPLNRNIPCPSIFRSCFLGLWELQPREFYFREQKQNEKLDIQNARRHDRQRTTSSLPGHKVILGVYTSTPSAVHIASHVRFTAAQVGG